jgi:CRISPR-associated protein Cmr4
VADNNSTWAGGLLGLHALTALHPGSGAALGTVDLPVQRERHTHWPNVAGSALKGILRDACREQVKSTHPDDGPEIEERERKTRRQKADADPAITLLFGPPTQTSSEHAGSVSVTDARLLAYPVRSLKGVFAWVTCPAVLERLQRDATLVGQKLPAFDPSRPAEPFRAIVPPGCPCLIEDRTLLLEEFQLGKVDGDPTALANWIAARLLPAQKHYAATRARFNKQLVIVHDDDFTHFVRYATEVTARIGLNYETKTVREGALFYQEFLPTESLFYSVVLVNAARARGEQKPASALLGELTGMLGKVPVLQVGGDETTGKGYCSIRLYTQEGGQ